MTTGRLQGWEDFTLAWSNIPIPEVLPTYYFEMEIVQRSKDGPMYLGLFPTDKALRGGLHQIGFCLDESGSCYENATRKDKRVEDGMYWYVRQCCS